MMEKLTYKNDLLLLMEFRQQHWELWKTFCTANGYEAELEDEE